MTFNATRAVFNQADFNQDGSIDRNEFNQWAAGGLGYGAGAGYGGSTYESSSYSNGGYGAGYGGLSYDSLYNNGVYGAGYGGSSYDSSYSSGGYGAGAGAGYGGSSVSYSSQNAVSSYPTDAQGLFLDSNPQIIRRPNANGVQTYNQNIQVRFLQPPPVPPHGPLIIKEVRPPQPPAPLPLRIRQQAPPLPQPLPLVLRERPPQPPASIASQTVIRRLAPLPVPPRSVVIERLPPLPPRPRNIVIERWVPYGAQAKRRTILQRAGPAVQYAAPRNVIIQYEPSQVRIVRQFQRLGVAQANPQAYLQQYGGSLLDSASLLQQARAAGVVEDISPPFVGGSIGYSASTYGQDANFGLSYNTNSSAYDAGLYDGGYGLGYNGGYGLGYNGGYGLGYDGYGGYSSYSSSGYGNGFDVAGVAFQNADTNYDGSIDRAEFAQFYQQGL